MGQSISCVDAAAEVPNARFNTLKEEYATLCPQIDALNTTTIDVLRSNTTDQNAVLNGYIRNVTALRDELGDLSFFTLSTFSNSQKRWVGRKISEIDTTVGNIQRLRKSKSVEDLGKVSIAGRQIRDEVDATKAAKKIEKIRLEKSKENWMFLKLLLFCFCLIVALKFLF